MQSTIIDKIQPIVKALNGHNKEVNGSKILFIGVANNACLNNTTESPALKIMDIVAKEGGEVLYYDPSLPEVATPSGRKFQSIEHLVLPIDNSSENLPFKPSILQSPKYLGSILLFMLAADCVVITSNHSEFDAETIQRHSKLTVDLISNSKRTHI